MVWTKKLSISAIMILVLYLFAVQAPASAETLTNSKGINAGSLFPSGQKHKTTLYRYPGYLSTPLPEFLTCEGGGTVYSYPDMVLVYDPIYQSDNGMNTSTGEINQNAVEWMVLIPNTVLTVPKADGKEMGSQEYIDIIEDKYDNTYFITPSSPAIKTCTAAQACLEKIMADIKNNSNDLENISEDNFIRLCKEINKMVHKRGSVYEALHYFRNYLNRVPETLDEMIELNKNLPLDKKWRMVDIWKSTYHMYDTDFCPQGEYNLKFVSADGMYEAVYRKDGTLLTAENDPVNMGTYNYFDPKDETMHRFYDVVPYKLWHNVSGVPIPKQDILKKYKENPDAEAYRNDILNRMRD